MKFTEADIDTFIKCIDDTGLSGQLVKNKVYKLIDVLSKTVIRLGTNDLHYSRRFIKVNLLKLKIKGLLNG